MCWACTLATQALLGQTVRAWWRRLAPAFKVLLLVSCVDWWLDIARGLTRSM